MITLRLHPKRNEILVHNRYIKLTDAQLLTIIQTLHDATYDRARDVFDLPNALIELGQTLGVK